MTKLKGLLRRLNLPVQEAYLFGSRARGDSLKESDVDVVIVSAGFKKYDFFQRMVEVSKKWNGPEPLEALCYTPEEFSKKKNQIGIVKEALTRGIRIA